jgi:hypothetical protein
MLGVLLGDMMATMCNCKRASLLTKGHVTAQQQSKEFVIATNLEAVNYGKNVGPDLVDWGREGSGAVLLPDERPPLSY